MPRMLDNILNSEWSVQGGWGGGALTSGNQFSVETTIYVDEIYWHRRSTGSDEKPTTMRLVNLNTSTALATISSPVDSGAIGDQVSIVDPPVELVPGTNYLISGSWPGAYQPFAIRSPSGMSAPPADIDFLASVRRWAVGSVVVPGNIDNANVTAVGIGWSTTPPPPDDDDPTTYGMVRDLFMEWFDTEAQSHSLTGIPALAWALLQTMEDTINIVEDKIDTVDALLETALGPVGNLATGALRGFLDNLESMIEDVQAAVGPFINDHTTAAKNEVLTAIEALPTGGGGLPAGPVSVAGGWTLRETISGTGKVKWDEPADAYILVRTGWDADRSINIYEGVNYFFDRGWWAPQQADVVEGYGTLAAATHLLRVPTGRMSGVLIVQDDDFEWDLQAWDAPTP